MRSAMRTMFVSLGVLALGGSFAQPFFGQTPGVPRPEVWKFDRLDKIGGLPITVLDHPL